MHPSVHARSNPDKAAIIVAETGEAISYGELDAASNRAAQLFRAHGLGHEDVVAFMLENTPHYYGLTWGAQRSGLRYVCISSRLTQDETDYILENSGAKMLVVSASLGAAAQQLTTTITRFAMGGDIDGWARWENAVAAMPATSVADERAGVDMLYSSGTTGRPKGVRVPLPEERAIDATNSLVMLASAVFQINSDSIYLSPAPLYHAAPLRWSMTIHRLGGTVVLMKKFDPEAALAHIEKYRVNSSQWVPTHFVRMLKLPAEVRTRYDTSSLKVAIHAAAPCPIPVKQAMIDWWGPVINEYYGSTEAGPLTFCTSADSLSHPATIGQALDGVTIRALDEDGKELPAGEAGEIHIRNDCYPDFTYINRSSDRDALQKGDLMATGDVGYHDEDGYWFICDRKRDLVISGGVNIYPAEIEAAIIGMPKVADCVVFGIPDAEFGEALAALVEPHTGQEIEPAEVLAHLRPLLAAFKLPRVIEQRTQLPRDEAGKIRKRILRDPYWQGAGRRI